MKHKIIQKIILIALGVVLMPAFAGAQTPRLVVEFIPDPLFSEASILPGDSTTALVRVTNNSGEDQVVITEAINVSDPTGLSSNMNLVLSDDSSNVFFNAIDGTFQDFLTSGIFELTNPIANGEVVEYTFDVSFGNSSDNSFQLAELGFDLCVGFRDDITGMNCGDTVVSGEGDTGGGTDIQGDGGTTTAGTGNAGGGGGGGPIDLVTLEISNERVVSIDDDTGTAVIAWETNLYSTSQVVYGVASGGPYSLMTDALNFGYPQATVEDEFKILSHAVVLNGLTPGEEYTYRVVSRASPATVSYAHNFVVEEQVLTPDDVAFIEETIEEIKRVESEQEGGNNEASNTIIASAQSGGGNSGSGGNTASNSQGQNGGAGGLQQQEARPTTTPEVESRRSELESLLEELTVEREEAEEVISPDSDSSQDGFAAAAFLSGMFGIDNPCLLHTLLALLAIAILYALYRATTGRHASENEKKIALLGLFIAAIIVSFVAKLPCTIPYLIIAYAVTLLSMLYKNRK